MPPTRRCRGSEDRPTTPNQQDVSIAVRKYHGAQFRTTTGVNKAESILARAMCGQAVGYDVTMTGVLSTNAALAKVPGLSLTSISLILSVGLKLPNRSQSSGVTGVLPFDCINEKYMFLPPHMDQASPTRHCALTLLC